MREDALKKLFETHKVPQSVRDYILENDSDDIGDDWNIDDALDNHIKARNEFFKEKHKSSIKDELETTLRKDIFKSITKPLSNRIRQVTGLDKADIEGVDWKDQVDLMAKHFKDQIEEAHANNDDELRKKYNDIVNKYSETTKELHNWEENYETRVQEVKDNFARKDNKRRVERKFREIISDESKIQLNAPASSVADAFLELWIPNAGYELYVDQNENGAEVLRIKGVQSDKAVSLDGSDFYDDPVQAIRDIAKQRQMLKVSNGGVGSGDAGAGGTARKTANKAIHQGREIDMTSTNTLKAQIAKEIAEGKR